MELIIIFVKKKDFNQSDVSDGHFNSDSGFSGLLLGNSGYGLDVKEEEVEAPEKQAVYFDIACFFCIF